MSRVFPHPLDATFAWLTDYQDDDPDRAGAVLESRPVKERHKDKIVLDATVNIMGRRGSGTTEVRLFPPDRYEAHLIKGGGRGSVYTYRLTPVKGGTRLDVDYGIMTRSFKGWLRVTLAGPFAKRELNKMWDGYAKAMAKEMAPEATSPSAGPS